MKDPQLFMRFGRGFDYSQDFGRGFMRLWERIHEDSCKTLGEDL